MFIKTDHGVHEFNAHTPCSQKIFNKDGLNPDIIETFSWCDKQGKPSVDLKFHNKICGGLKGFPCDFYALLL